MVCLIPNTKNFPLHQLAFLMEGTSGAGADTPSDSGLPQEKGWVSSARVGICSERELCLPPWTVSFPRAQAVHLPSAWDPPKVGPEPPPSDWEYPLEALSPSSQIGISLRASSGPPPSDWELPEGRGESECLCQPSTPRHLQLEDTQPAAFLSLTMPRAGLPRSPSRSCQQAAKPQCTPGIN